MVDGIENVHGSIVQHGPFNDRIYVLYLAAGDPNRLISRLDKMANHYGYSKILAKIPAIYSQDFSSAGYVKEAEIPGFFNGNTDCFFVSKFFKNRQKTDENFSKLYSFASKGIAQSAGCSGKEDIYNIEVCSSAEAQELSLLYGQVFPSYPFPISDPSYLSQIMKENVTYYCIRMEGSVTAAAAIEANHHGQYAEMTDFATLPEWSGKGLAQSLLRHMDAVVHGSHIKTLYTIARASSYGMNRVFGKCGYTYAGLLINNTQISGSIQSMSVWYRHT